MLLLLLLRFAYAVDVHDVPHPREAGGWVSDTQQVLSEDERAQINEISEALNRDLTVELAIVTIDDCEQTPKQFATELFNHWGIGDEQANNGLLVLMVMGQRRLEMETGDGLVHVLTDTSLKAIQSDVMVPNFKQGKFGAGLLAGIQYVDSELRRQKSAAEKGNRENSIENNSTKPAEAPKQPDQEEAGELTFAEAITGFFVLLFGFAALGVSFLSTAGFSVFLLRLVRRRGPKYCKNCAEFRIKLSETTEDQHLSTKQVHEEEIGSVQYDVYVCPACQSPTVVGRSTWFSGYSQCPRCSTRSMTVTSETLEQATYTSSGLVEVTESCTYRPCGRQHFRRKRTPILQRSENDGSSIGGGSFGGGSFGGGSFGGGSSSGGGAGSSW